MQWSSELRGFGACAAISLLLGATSAHAALGESVASVHVDQMAMGGVRRLARVGTLQTHTVLSEDGSVIRQFVSPDGMVVAIAWNTRYKPRLDQLLGSHFGVYAAAARDASPTGRGMVRRATVQRGELVVESSSYLGSYQGRAYLQSRLPYGVSIDAAR